MEKISLENHKSMSECNTYEELIKSVDESLDYWLNLENESDRATRNIEYFRGVKRGINELIELIKKNPEGIKIPR